MAYQSIYLVATEHYRQPPGLLGPLDSRQPGKFNAQHLLVEEQQGRQRLILRSRRGVTIAGEMAQKGRYFLSAHLPGMPFAVKEDESFDPAEIRLLGAEAVMLQPDARTHYIEQFGSL
jgi:hypothetical protein